jgi:hypothetical protein
MKLIMFFLFVVLMTLGNVAYTAPPKSNSPKNSEVGVTKPLEVTGQNRTLNMMSAYNNEKITIGFGKPRVDYRPQILSTVY